MQVINNVTQHVGRARQIGHPQVFGGLAARSINQRSTEQICCAQGTRLPNQRACGVPALHLHRRVACEHLDVRLALEQQAQLGNSGAASTGENDSLVTQVDEDRKVTHCSIPLWGRDF